MLPFSGHCFATSATLAQIRAATLGTEVCYEVNREHYTLLGASSECLKLIKLNWYSTSHYNQWRLAQRFYHAYRKDKFSW